MDKRVSTANSNRFGAFLKQLRSRRNLGLSRVAQAAGLNRSTLHRWERGETLPRLVELEAMLNALEATAQQRRQALALMEAPRAQAVVRAHMHRVSEDLMLASFPHGGDLLRAMRLRKRWSLEQTAQRVGVSEWTVRRWERGTVWPSCTQLHTLCFVLDAEEEEIVALTCGQLRFAGDGEHGQGLYAVTALEDKLQRALKRINYGEQRLMELELLHLKRQVWELARSQDAARSLLPFAWYVHATLYSLHNRNEEAARLARVGLELLPQGEPMQSYMLFLAVDQAEGAAYSGRRPSPRRGAEMLRPWLEVDRWPFLNTWIRSTMAKMLACAGDVEAGVTLSREALEQARDLPPREQARRAGAHAEILLDYANRPAEALQALPAPGKDTPIFHALEGVLHTGILLELKEVSDARLRLDQVQTLVIAHELNTMLPQIEALQRRLESRA